MIGTTFTLGFNGAAVQRGLGQVSGMLGRVSRQIGVGAARQIGAGVTDLMGRIVMAIPNALKETADWAGNMTDMSAQTGVSVESLIMLEEKLRLSGAAARDTSMIISRLADNLATASTEGGPAKDALNKLGFFADEFVGMNVDEAFEKIGQRVAELGPEFVGLESIMGDLFGTRMGYKLIRFFKTFEESNAAAERNVGAFARSLGPTGLAGDLDTWSDALGRFETLKRSLSSMVLAELFRVSGGANSVDKMFSFLDPEKIRPKIQEAMSFIGRNLETLLSQDLTTSFGDIFKNMGKEFGEGLKSSFKIDTKSLIPMMFGAFGQNNKGSGNDAATSELSRHTVLLERIEQKVGPAYFA